VINIHTSLRICITCDTFNSVRSTLHAQQRSMIPESKPWIEITSSSNLIKNVMLLRKRTLAIRSIDIGPLSQRPIRTYCASRPTSYWILSGLVASSGKSLMYFFKLCSSFARQLNYLLRYTEIWINSIVTVRVTIAAVFRPAPIVTQSPCSYITAFIATWKHIWANVHIFPDLGLRCSKYFCNDTVNTHNEQINYNPA